jgi:predicted transcriptional regulator
MKTEGIPEDVKQFIFGHISSVMQLEVLLFLARHAQQEWTVSALVKEFRVDPGWVETELGELCAHGLLLRNKSEGSSEGSYQYLPSTVELEQAVAGLAKAYADRRVTVTTLIYSKPVDNIRVFADSFRLRKG